MVDVTDRTFVTRMKGGESRSNPNDQMSLRRISSTFPVTTLNGVLAPCMKGQLASIFFSLFPLARDLAHGRRSSNSLKRINELIKFEELVL